MNQIRQSTFWLPAILSTIVFIAILVLTLLNLEQLQAAVLDPLLYLLWLGDLLFRSFDQGCIWMLALLIALVVSVSTTRRKKDKTNANHMPTRRRSLAAGRVKFWQGQIRVGSSAVYERSYRRSELRRLTLKVLASHEGCSTEDIKAQLRTGQLQVSPEVQYVLGLDSDEATANRPLSLIARIHHWLKTPPEHFRTENFSPDPRLDIVARYLESIMENDS